MELKKPMTAVIVGAGRRAVLYASYALDHPQEMKIVGLAEPDEVRRTRIARQFHIPEDRCYRTAQELADRPVFAEAAINGTMDRDHVPTTLPLLRAGYHVLLEKPIAPSREELISLLEVARETGRTVFVCHVLRYAPFYAEIRRKVAEGQIGQIISIHTSERVEYHHLAVGFVRGKWNRGDTTTSMLMQKCCHDLDLICWMKSGVAPRWTASQGALMYFRPEKAPAGSGTRCLVDCKIEETCPYSAKKNYIDQDLWGMYVWDCLEHISNPTIEQKLESLRTNNIHGRCVWRCDNTVVDHQSVTIEFEDGCVATHDMLGNTARACRTVHLVGTAGEIEGTLEDGWFVLRRPDPGAKYSIS